MVENTEKIEKYYKNVKITHACVLHHVLFFVTLESEDSIGFSRQEYWKRLPCPPLGDLPDPGIEPGSPALQVDSLLSEPPEKPTGELHGTILRIRFSYTVLEC